MLQSPAFVISVQRLEQTPYTALHVLLQAKHIWLYSL